MGLHQLGNESDLEKARYHRAMLVVMGHPPDAGTGGLVQGGVPIGFQRDGDFARSQGFLEPVQIGRGEGQGGQVDGT